MRGVVFTGDRTLDLTNFPDPTPGPGEVVLEMKASGMCGSDLHQYRRPNEPGDRHRSPGTSRAAWSSPSARAWPRPKRRSAIA